MKTVLALLVGLFAHSAWSDVKCDLPVGTFVLGSVLQIKAKLKSGEEKVVYIEKSVIGDTSDHQTGMYAGTKTVEIMSNARIVGAGEKATASASGATADEAFYEARMRATQWCNYVMKDSVDGLVKCMGYKALEVEFQGKIIPAMDSPFASDKEICN